MPESSSISGKGNSRSSILRGDSSTAANVFSAIDQILFIRFIGAQRRNDLLAEEADRAEQVVFREPTEIEFAEERVEGTFLGPSAQLSRDGVGRADQHQLFFDEIVGIEHVHD